MEKSKLLRNRIKNLVILVLLPVVISVSMGYYIFEAGIKMGLTRQEKTDLPVLKNCSERLKEVNIDVARLSSSSQSFERSEVCESVCLTLERSTQGYIMNVGAFKAADSSCVCYMVPNL